MKFRRTLSLTLVALSALGAAGCSPQGSQSAELDAAKSRIAQLESELKAVRSKMVAGDVATPAAASDSQVVAAADAASAAVTQSEESAWSYDSREDKMNGRKVTFAKVTSSNTVNFGFPYQGAQHGHLTLRAGNDRDVIFSIERGQLMCNSYDGCTVKVRFDDGKPESFSAIGPADNSSETVFLHNYKGFMAKMRKAKVVRLSMNIYDQGSPVFEFDVRGFNEDRYLGKTQ